MKLLTVEIEDEAHRELKTLAAAMGVTMSDLIRDAVHQMIYRDDPVLRATKASAQAADRAQIQSGELSSEDVALIPASMIKRCRVEAEADFFD